MGQEKYNNITYVDVTLKIEIGQSWDANCTLKQVQEQAIKDAKRRVLNILRVADEQTIQGITIEGDPSVTIAFIKMP